MSNLNLCKNELICPNGDCVGCKDGEVWCQDPRCQPYCPRCQMLPDHDYNANITIAIVLMCLIAILFVVWFAYGPSLFIRHSDHEIAGVIYPST